MIMQKIMKKERYLAIFFFVAAFIISLLVGTLSMRKAEAEVNYNAPQIQAEYALDTTFTLPAVSFDIDGEAVATKGSLKFPSGKIYTNQTIVLNEEGSYELQYQAVVAGKLYQNKIPFIVKADFADLFDTTKNVSMQYGESTIWDEGENVFIIAEKLCKLECCSIQTDFLRVFSQCNWIIGQWCH